VNAVNERSPTSVQSEARAFFEARLGRCVTDEEWAAFRERLLAFVQLLRSWEAENSVSRSSTDVGWCYRVCLLANEHCKKR
jgi:hypothetical protein